MATELARSLERKFSGITASTKRDAGAASGKKKQLDVNFSTPGFGLLLGISLKSVHTRDTSSPYRYTHNVKRNIEELLVEVAEYHRRQPYAVMIGIVFLPFDSCDDGRKGNPSSFGSWVQALRRYQGRSEPEDDPSIFEKIYVALYEPEPAELQFFDVASAPPKNGRPKTPMTYGEFLDAVHDAYAVRNHTAFRWADGETEELEVSEEFRDDDQE